MYNCINGNSSQGFFVHLPDDAFKRMGLKPGQSVKALVQNDGSCVLYPCDEDFERELEESQDTVLEYLSIVRRLEVS